MRNCNQVHDIADIWTTELHLSFLQLVDVEERPREGAPEGETVCDGHQRRFFHRYKGSEHDIYKASLSCRFVGDMGDRYWSGYLLAYLPRKLELLESLDDSGNEEDREQWDNCYRWFRRDNHNDQRNILEPFLVEKMVAEAYQSTKRILASVNDYLEPEIDKPKYEKEPTYSHISKVDERNYQAQYSRRSNALPDLEDTLILLNRFSEANCENLRIWQKRETERFHRPRWSRKDELKYRLLVDSQKRLAVRQVSLLIDQRGQIQTTLNRIKSLKQEVTGHPMTCG